MNNNSDSRVMNNRDTAVKNNNDSIPPVNLNNVINHLQQSLTDDQRKVIMTRLRREAYLGLKSYDDSNECKLYLYKSMDLYNKDRKIAQECINNDKQVPPDVEHRLLAEKEARRKARNIEQEKFEKTLPEYLRHRR